VKGLQYQRVQIPTYLSKKEITRREFDDMRLNNLYLSECGAGHERVDSKYFYVGRMAGCDITSLQIIDL